MPGTLLLRPDEVLSGILEALVLEAADDALGVLLQPNHVRAGGLTQFREAPNKPPQLLVTRLN